MLLLEYDYFRLMFKSFVFHFSKKVPNFLGSPELLALLSANI